MIRRSLLFFILGLTASACNCGGKSTSPPPLGAPVIVNVTVTPPIAPPGANVTIAAVALSTDGYPVNFTWTVPTGWTATGSTTTDTLSLVAPDLFGQTAQVGLKVDDGHGQSNSTSIAVFTGVDSAPTATITATPSSPSVGTPVTLTSKVAAAFGQSVTYAWTLMGPEVSGARLSSTTDAQTTFTPDVAGTYTAQLVVTDPQNLMSAPATALITVAYAAPAVVSLTAAPPVASPGGRVSVTAVASSGDGYPLQYTWTIPPGWTLVDGSNNGADAGLDDAGIDDAGVTDAGLDDAGSSDAGVTDSGVIDSGSMDSGSDDAGADDAGMADAGTSGGTEIIAGSTIILQAPPDLGESGQLVLVVSDGHGQSAPASVTIATANDMAPTASFTSSPTDPRAGTPVNLIATASAAYGQTLTYTWTLIAPSGSNAAMTEPMSGQATFTPDMAGNYSVQLIVIDATGLSSSPVTVTIHVNADAAPQISSVTASSQQVPPGGLVTVTAVAQSPDGYALTYDWTIPPGWTPVGSTTGSTLVLQAPTQFNSSATILVKVDDGHGGTATSGVLVSTGADMAPVATVTANPSNPLVGTPVTLTSTATAADGQTVTYAWSFTQQPLASMATLTSTTGATSGFTPDAAGQYTVQLIVIDQAGTPSAPAMATINVKGFVAPTISSLTAVPATAAPGGSVSVTALVSSNDGYPVHYTWNIPAGWTAVGSTDTNTLVLTAPTTFLDVAQVGLTVDDGHGATATASVAVSTGMDTVPTVSVASTPSDPIVGLPVTLIPTVSAAGNQPVTYQWTLLQLPDTSQATLSSTTASQVTFTPDIDGTYEAQLIVTDQTGLSSLPATVSIVAHYGTAVSATLSYAPQNPVPGTEVTVLSQVSSLNPGAAVTYKWTLTSIPVGSKAVLSSTSTPNVTFIADLAGTYVAQLSVTSALTGESAPATISIVSKYGPPTAVIAGKAPLPGLENIAMTLDGSQSTDPAGNPLAYQWTIISTPAGSACNGTTCFGQTQTSAKPTFTPDMSGSFKVQLTVTSTAGLTDTVTADIGVQPVFSLAIYGPTAQSSMDGGGGGSSPPACLCPATCANPGTAQSGTTCSSDCDCAAGLTCDTGSHTCQCECEIPQVALAGDQFQQPLVVSMMSNSGAPIANSSVNWIAANGTVVSSVPTTDQNGLAYAVVKAGRVAGPMTVVAEANGETVKFTETVQAQPAASFAVGLTPGGTVDSAIGVSVTVVDEFGNPTTTPSPTTTGSFENATLLLTLTSPSGLATFDATASSGSIAVIPGSGQANVTLSNGQFVGSIHDSIAETIKVTLSRGNNPAALPFSNWVTQLYDGAENGLGNWNLFGLDPAWAAEKAVVKDGSYSFGVTLNNGQQLTSTQADLVAKSAFTGGPGTTVTLLDVDWNVQLDGVEDTTQMCPWVTQLRPRMSGSATSPSGTNYLTPVSGWGIYTSCDNTVPTLGPTTGWTPQVIDLTDALCTCSDGSTANAYSVCTNNQTCTPTTSYLDFNMTNAPDSNVLPLGPTSWALDDVWVKTLTFPSFNSATATQTVAPGAATSLRFGSGTGTTAPLLFGQCVNGTGYVVTVQALDQFGNQSTANPVIEVDWAGASSSLTPTASVGTIDGLTQSGVQIQLSQGFAQIALADPVSEPLTFSLNPMSSGLTAGSNATVNGQPVHCHGDGYGQSWTDTATPATYNATEALSACQSYYGLGNCSANSTYAYPTNVSNGSCGTAFTNSWFYAPLNASSSCGSASIGAGQTTGIHDSTPSCNCSTTLGQTINVSSSGTTAAWQ